MKKILIIYALFAMNSILYGQVSVQNIRRQDTLAGQAFTEPEFPGGKDSLAAFIRHNFSYERKGLCSYPSNFLVEFSIDEHGNVYDIRPLRPPEADVYKEVMRVFKLMPKWKAAFRGQQAVKTTQRLTFQITS